MAERLHIMQHAMGMDDYGRFRRGDYRNHYVVGAGAPAHDECMALVAEGLMMIFGRPSELTGGMNCFVVTDAGRRWVQNNSPAPPRRNRDQKRYDAYLAADSNLKFGEWLKRRGYAHG